MSKRNRRKHSSEQKAALLKKHLVEKVPVSDVCDQAEVQPSLFYNWQRQLFENAASVFEEGGKKRASSQEQRLQARIAELEARVAQQDTKLAKKDTVIAEISEEFVKLKKTSGEP